MLINEDGFITNPIDILLDLLKEENLTEEELEKLEKMRVYCEEKILIKGEEIMICPNCFSSIHLTKCLSIDANSKRYWCSKCNDYYEIEEGDYSMLPNKETHKKTNNSIPKMEIEIQGLMNEGVYQQICGVLIKKLGGNIEINLKEIDDLAGMVVYIKNGILYCKAN